MAALACSRDPIPPEKEENPLDRPETAEEAAYQEPDAAGTVLRWNYQNTFIYVVSGNMETAVTDNPRRAGANKTRRCLEVRETDRKYGVLTFDAVTKKFDFTAQPPVFRLKALSPRRGTTVRLQLISEESWRPAVNAEAKTRSEYSWEDLVFDFGTVESNLYNRIGIQLSRTDGEEPGVWYFDEIRIPDDDLTAISLFRRVEGNPVMKPDPARPWMDSHIANAAILSPENSRDGNWWMYPRGSDQGGNREHIGVFTQPAADFKPLGPWVHYDGNPVIEVGPPGSYDEWRILDGAPVVGPDGITYLYYKARRNYGYGDGIGLAWSEDGYHFTKLPDAWMAGGGITDALYHDGKYYVFRGGDVDVLENPLTREGCQTFHIMDPGGAPSNMDNKIFWGNMVFRLAGVDKWFMAYQGSASQWDFPDRFHVALSDDLIHWEKVQNTQPFFSRGSAGQWDQGGIWYPEVFEVDGILYMYYEGWGKEGYSPQRDVPYAEGRSCVGAASCKKADFLRWCGLED